MLARGSRARAALVLIRRQDEIDAARVRQGEERRGHGLALRRRAPRRQLIRLARSKTPRLIPVSRVREFAEFGFRTAKVLESSHETAFQSSLKCCSDSLATPLSPTPFVLFFLRSSWLHACCMLHAAMHACMHHARACDMRCVLCALDVVMRFSLSWLLSVRQPSQTYGRYMRMKDGSEGEHPKRDPTRCEVIANRPVQEQLNKPAWTPTASYPSPCATCPMCS